MYTYLFVIKLFAKLHQEKYVTLSNQAGLSSQKPEKNYQKICSNFKTQQRSVTLPIELPSLPSNFSVFLLSLKIVVYYVLYILFPEFKVFGGKIV